MNPLHARTIAAQRQLNSGESLNDFADVIELALRRLAKEGK
jgi:hypothetical protein